MAERYGSGFGEKSLRRMFQVAMAFLDAEIVAALHHMQRALRGLRFECLELPARSPMTGLRWTGSVWHPGD